MKRSDIEKRIFAILDKVVPPDSTERVVCGDPENKERFTTTHRFWFDSELQDGEAQKVIETEFGVELGPGYHLWGRSDEEIVKLVTGSVQRKS